MSVYSFRESLETKKRNISAKPLNENVKIDPKKSMVMFNLRGTLTRNGILVRKLLRYVVGQSFDKTIGKNNEKLRIPVVHAISDNLEVLLQKNIQGKNNPEKIFSQKAIKSTVHDALEMYAPTLSKTQEASEATKIDLANDICYQLTENYDTKKILKKACSIYEQQIHKNDKPFIAPEVTQIVTNLANLGVPVAIVSNMAQDIVNEAHTAIVDTLSEDTRKKWKTKQWHFAKIGVQRDVDGDVIQSIKPAADLLTVSYRKASKFNKKNNKDKIENVIFVGSNEAFDMRAADNLQRSNYGVDNNLNVYKLLSTHDNPEKSVKDRALTYNNSAVKDLSKVNERLMNSLKTEPTQP